MEIGKLGKSALHVGKRDGIQARCLEGYILDGELAALDIVLSAFNPSLATAGTRLQCNFQAQLDDAGGLLTANTLNNEVFPAFCRPIMVMSISVALFAMGDGGVSSSPSHVYIFAFYHHGGKGIQCAEVARPRGRGKERLS